MIQVVIGYYNGALRETLANYGSKLPTDNGPTSNYQGGNSGDMNNFWICFDFSDCLCCCLDMDTN